MPGFIVRGVDGEFGGSGHPHAGNATHEFIYNYTWQIINLMDTNVSDKPSEAALIYAKEMTLPTFSVGIESQQGASLEYKFAKSVSWDDVKVTFYDSVGMIEILRRWRQRVWTQLQGLQQASVYKKESRFDVLPPDWDANAAVKWRLFGSWPSAIKHGDLTYTASDVKIVEVTITYDWADEIGLPGVGILGSI